MITLLDAFNLVYKYKSDLEKYNTSLDVWEIPELESDGFIYGDCESYCRFLKSNIKVFENWEYTYCKLDGVGHCVLIKDGMIIDCNIRSIVSIQSYERIYNVTDFSKYSLFTIVSKIIVGKLYTTFYKLFKK